MVDAERLLAILGRITARLAILEGYAGQDRDALLADRVRLGDLKYTFVGVMTRLLPPDDPSGQAG